METVKRISLYIFYGLLAYMPLHIFISTWLGSSLNILDQTKTAKDVVLLVGAVLAFIPSVGQKWFKDLFKDRLVQLILAYTGITILMALIKPTEADAEILGMVYNTRFLLFFLYAVLLTHLYSAKHLIKRYVQIVLGAGLLVLVFGIFQYTLLPDTALSHVGYKRANGVLPAFFIDDKPDLERVMSTLRDPNSLGSYIIIIGAMALAGLVRFKNKGIKNIAKWYLVLSLLCLWFTFSRSAWLGFILAAVAVAIFSFKKTNIKPKKVLIIGVLSLGLIIFGGLIFKDSYFVQNVVFHADIATVLEDPNQLRARFFKESVSDIANNPAGSGPGTAGLASIRNQTQGTVLNENYYLQIATEVGVLGLILFILIITTVAYRLYGLNSHTIGIALLASLIGLSFTNLLVHIWSNEAVAYTWWGLAGLILFSKNYKTKS